MSVGLLTLTPTLLTRFLLSRPSAHTELTFSCFDSEVAFSLGTLIRSTYSSEEGERTGVLITIRLFSGLTLFQSACGPNVNPTNEDWVRRKFNTGEGKKGGEVRKTCVLMALTSAGLWHADASQGQTAGEEGPGHQLDWGRVRRTWWWIPDHRRRECTMSCSGLC